MVSWLQNVAKYLFASLVWLWCLGGVYSLDQWLPFGLTLPATLGVMICIPFLWFSSRRKLAWFGLIGISCGLLATLYLVKPTHEREWGVAQRVLPSAAFDGDRITIRKIRSFRYENGKQVRKYFDLQLDRRDVRSVWFGVDRFSSVEPLAHTFLSFEIDNGKSRQFISVSIETRRELSETTYSPIRGIYANYETIYILADEQDVLSLRSDVRQHEVQLYPLRASSEQAQKMFIDVLNRANEISENPEFYNTLTNNCTNNLVSHANRALGTEINPAALSVVFPGYSDWLAHQYQMLDTDLSLEAAREKFRVDQRVAKFDGHGNFSEYIRDRE